MSKYTKKQNEEITAFGDAEYDTGFSDGVTTEQERILALLNSKRDTGSHDSENDFINALLDDLSALIKGEK